MLKERYTVYDMRITGDNVYFCGTVNDGGKAVLFPRPAVRRLLLGGRRTVLVSERIDVNNTKRML